jgi:2-polyprenyl-3-methyl-5-hydroxy-6-metoxy-1,4-benzoquinol methylase
MKNYLEINKKAYGQLAEEYNKRCNQNLINQKRLLLDFIKLLKENFSHPIKVLDVGCGVGINCKILEEQGISCAGVDFSSKMLEYAKVNSPKSRFILKNFLEYETEEKFHGIILGSFLNLFQKEDLRKVIAKIQSLLVCNGMIVVYTKLYPKTKEGIFIKDGYLQKVNRFVKFWKRNDFIKYIESHFKIISEKSGYGDPSWAVFILKNRKP